VDLTSDTNPWRGLEPYNYGNRDAPFCGRDREVERLSGLIVESTFVIVTGPSGCGKSSLVQAGVLPRFQNKADWQVLQPIAPRDAFADKPIIDRLRGQCLADQTISFILLVDQLEEVLTSRGVSTDEVFLRDLESLLASPPANLHIVVTLRADFELRVKRALRLEALWPKNTDKSRFIPAPLSAEELRQVVTAPAAERSVFFDPPDLVDCIVVEVVNSPGALPLISHALSELYLQLLVRRRQRDPETRTIIRQDYIDMEGVLGSLRTSADKLYQEMADDHKLMMENILMRMVSLQGGEPTRRRVYSWELEFDSESDRNICEEVLQRLRSKRLITTFAAEQKDDSYHQPSHDALIQAWDRLKPWISGERRDWLLVLRDLTAQAREYSQTPMPKLLWHNNPKLDSALQWFLGNKPRMIWRFGRKPKPQTAAPDDRTQIAATTRSS
jgi:energy-coupling factor transporter ATP-binding protein EcfA2